MILEISRKICISIILRKRSIQMCMQISRILWRKEIKLNTVCIISLLMPLHKNSNQVICLSVKEHDFNKSLFLDNIILLLANFQERNKSFSTNSLYFYIEMYIPFLDLVFNCMNSKNQCTFFFNIHTQQCL